MSDCSQYTAGTPEWFQCQERNRNTTQKVPYYGVLKPLIESIYGSNCHIDFGMDEGPIAGPVKQFEVYNTLKTQKTGTFLMIACLEIKGNTAEFTCGIPGIKKIVLNAKLNRSSHDAETSTYNARSFEDFFNYVENHKK